MTPGPRDCVAPRHTTGSSHRSSAGTPKRARSKSRRSRVGATRTSSVTSPRKESWSTRWSTTAITRSAAGPVLRGSPPARTHAPVDGPDRPRQTEGYKSDRNGQHTEDRRANARRGGKKGVKEG